MAICREFHPARYACAGRIPPDAALNCPFVSHADDSIIGSIFCQDRLLEMQNAE
jgi:hypothetical protein